MRLVEGIKHLYDGSCMHFSKLRNTEFALFGQYLNSACSYEILKKRGDQTYGKKCVMWYLNYYASGNGNFHQDNSESHSNLINSREVVRLFGRIDETR